MVPSFSRRAQELHEKYAPNGELFTRAELSALDRLDRIEAPLSSEGRWLEVGINGWTDALGTARWLEKRCSSSHVLFTGIEPAPIRPWKKKILSQCQQIALKRVESATHQVQLESQWSKIEEWRSTDHLAGVICSFPFIFPATASAWSPRWRRYDATAFFASLLRNVGPGRFLLLTHQGDEEYQEAEKLIRTLSAGKMIPLEVHIVEHSLQLVDQVVRLVLWTRQTGPDRSTSLPSRIEPRSSSS